MNKLFLLFAILALSAWGTAATLPADAPRITSEMRAQYWRAQAEAIAASVQAQQASSRLTAIQEKLAKACGEQQLIAGPDGEPICAPRPDKLKEIK